MENNQSLNISEMVKSLRKERSISQKDLSALAGVSVAVISRIENGDLQVNASSLDNILKVFGFCLGGVKPKTNRFSFEDSNEV